MKVLAIVAHSDDEALGCGGTLAKHVLEGDEVFAVHLTDGVGARESDETDRARRLAAAESAAAALGFRWLTSATFPDNAMDSVPLLEINRFVEEIVEEVEPALIYTHHGADLNLDHRLTFQAVLTACRPQPGHSVYEIRSFEVPSSTEWSHDTIGRGFAPNLFVDITGVWGKKQLALEAYQDEMRPWPHARSMEAVRALASWRGATVGLAAAEAFEIVRRVEVAK